MLKITHWPFNQNAPWLLWKKKGTMAWLWPPGADGCRSTPSLQFYKRPRCGSLFGCLMCHLHRADGARQDVRRGNWQKEHGDFFLFFIFKIKKTHTWAPQSCVTSKHRKDKWFIKPSLAANSGHTHTLGGETTKSAISDHTHWTARLRCTFLRHFCKSGKRRGTKCALWLHITHFASSKQALEMYANSRFLIRMPFKVSISYLTLLD